MTSFALLLLLLVKLITSFNNPRRNTFQHRESLILSPLQTPLFDVYQSKSDLELGHHSAEEDRRIVKEAEWIETLKHEGAILLLDMSNIRGKAFGKTQDVCNTQTGIIGEEKDLVELRKCILGWLSNLSDSISSRSSVIFVCDHGVQQQAYLTVHNDAVLFAGGLQTADDLIAHSIPYIQQVLRRNVVVVTNDQLLWKRCRARSIDSRLGKKKLKKEAIAKIAPTGRYSPRASRESNRVKAIEKQLFDTKFIREEIHRQLKNSGQLYTVTSQCFVECLSRYQNLSRDITKPNKSKPGSVYYKQYLYFLRDKTESENYNQLKAEVNALRQLLKLYNKVSMNYNTDSIFVANTLVEMQELHARIDFLRETRQLAASNLQVQNTVDSSNHCKSFSSSDLTNSTKAILRKSTAYFDAKAMEEIIHAWKRTRSLDDHQKESEQVWERFLLAEDFRNHINKDCLLMHSLSCMSMFDSITDQPINFMPIAIARNKNIRGKTTVKKLQRHLLRLATDVAGNNTFSAAIRNNDLRRQLREEAVIQTILAHNDRQFDPAFSSSESLNTIIDKEEVQAKTQLARDLLKFVNYFNNMQLTSVVIL